MIDSIGNPGMPPGSGVGSGVGDGVGEGSGVCIGSGDGVGVGCKTVNDPDKSSNSTEKVSDSVGEYSKITVSEISGSKTTSCSSSMTSLIFNTARCEPSCPPTLDTSTDIATVSPI